MPSNSIQQLLRDNWAAAQMPSQSKVCTDVLRDRPVKASMQSPLAEHDPYLCRKYHRNARSNLCNMCWQLPEPVFCQACQQNAKSIAQGVSTLSHRPLMNGIDTMHNKFLLSCATMTGGSSPIATASQRDSCTW